MPRTITVRGVGRVSTPPDQISITLALQPRDMDYDKAMDLAENQLAALQAALNSAGFDKKQLKTAGFNVRADYETRWLENGGSESVFKGYVVRHELKLEFPMDLQQLGRALSAIALCGAQPQFSIRFTVKDPGTISKALLQSAAENAREKAKTLCAASGVKLKKLQSIEYNWGELNVYSNTCCDMAEEALTPMMAKRSIDITPEDIETSDSAVFVWEIGD